MDPMITFGAWLRRQRKHAGWTQRELADRSGYSYSTITKLEQDYIQPCPEAWQQLAALFPAAPPPRPTPRSVPAHANPAESPMMVPPVPAPVPGHITLALTWTITAAPVGGLYPPLCDPLQMVQALAPGLQINQAASSQPALNAAPVSAPPLVA